MTTKEFRDVLSRVGWTMNLDTFCATLGWREDDYARHKFSDFQQMCQLINQFDSITLDLLVQAGRVARKS